MPEALYIGFNDLLIEDIKHALAEVEFLPIDKGDVTIDALHHANAVIIGPNAPRSVSLAQKISRLDNSISILLLERAERIDMLKKEIRFMPFISQNTSCYLYDIGVVPDLKRAITQNIQRRRFATIKSSAKIEAALRPPVLHIEQLGSFLQQAPIGTLLLDTALRVIAINQLAQSIFNLAQKNNQILPQLIDLMPEAEVEKITSTLKNQHIDKKVVEISILNKFLEVTLSEVISEIGASYIILLINDITERKLEQTRLRTILNSLPQMGWITDNEGSVTYLTEGWYKYTHQDGGKSMDEWITFIHPDDREAVISKWKQSLTDGQLFEQQARYKKHTGKYIWHLVRAVPIYDANNQILYWLGIATDIEKQKLIEKELENKVDARTAELQEANIQLQKSNTDLGQFAYIASHDLQEPLRKIHIFSSMIENNINDEAKTKEYISKINAAVLRMSNLISGILEHSNLSANKGGDRVSTDVNLNTVINEVKADFDLLLVEKKATIQADKLPIVKGIHLQLTQLFSNLISNAIKYSTNAPVINISSKIVTNETSHFKELPKDKSFVEIVVRDNGIGFEQKNAEHIFNIFSRLHSQANYAGTGIGLALCKKIIDNHHGFINATSELGKGSSFYIYLPV